VTNSEVSQLIFLAAMGIKIAIYNTFANFIKHPQARDFWGYTNKVHLRGLKSWVGCEGSLCSYSDTLLGCWVLAKVLIYKGNF
jgi:hypothetical protein